MAVLLLPACGPYATRLGPPTITDVTPADGSGPSDALVTLTGDGFIALPEGPAVEVSVCGVALADVDVRGPTRRVLLPTGEVTRAVVGMTLTGRLVEPLERRAYVELVRFDGQRAVWGDAATCTRDQPSGPDRAPVAVDDEPAPDSTPGTSFHAPMVANAEATPWTLTAPGVLANDDRGAPAAALVSFGGGTLGGAVGDHAAGSTVEADGHRLHVAADGAVEFAPAVGFTGVFLFEYAVGNPSGASHATVAIAVGHRPRAGADLSYPHTLIGNVGIDTARSSGATVPLAGDALVATVADVVGGDATVACAAGSSTCTFAFEPTAGFTGEASFQVTATNGFGSVGPVRVSLAVEHRVWFVDAAAAPGGNGTLAAPFDCLRSQGCAANGVLEAGDAMFVAAGTYGAVDGRSPAVGWLLPTAARLIGAGASDALPELLGYSWPDDATPAPATGGVRPLLNAATTSTPVANSWILLGRDNLLAGITLAGVTDYAVRGVDFGALRVEDVRIEGVREVLALRRGTLAGGFSSLSNVTTAGLALYGVHLDSVDTVGTFSFGDGVLTAARPVVIEGGGGTFVFGADLIAEMGPFGPTSGAIRVAGMTSGSVSFAGSVDARQRAGIDQTTDAVGVLITGLSGDAQVRFLGAVFVTAYHGTAVRLTDNASSTSVEFPGGLGITATEAARGLHASGGGTIGGNVTSVSSERGVAVDVEGMTLSATGLTIAALNAGTSNGGPAHALRIVDVSGSGDLRVLGGTVQRTTSHALLVERAATVEVSGMSVTNDVCSDVACGIDGVRAIAVRDLTVRDGAFLGGNHGIYVAFSPGITGRATIRTNEIGSTRNDAMYVRSFGEPTQTTASQVAITDNVIGGPGRTVGLGGIHVAHEGAAGARGTMLVAEVRGNSISAVGHEGVLVRVVGEHESDTTRVDATIENNTVGAAGDLVRASLSGPQQSLCFDLRLTSWSSAPTSGFHNVYLDHRSQRALVLPGYGGGPTDTAAVQSFVLANNGGGSSALASAPRPGSAGYVNGLPCTTP